MGRLPTNNADNSELKKGPWTPEEDQKLIDHVQNHGHGSWQLLPKKAGLKRCGKSCRLRWTNYLRPDIKHGNFSPEEEQTIINLHSMLGNKWATIATRLPGRTDNEIKNYWNTQLRKKLMRSGIDPKTHQPISHHDNHLNLLLNLPNNPNFNSLIPFQNLAKIQILSNILQVLNPNPVQTFLGGSQQNFNQLEGLFHGISDHSVQLSSMVPNMEYLDLMPTNFQPICDTFAIPDELNSKSKGTIGSSSNTKSEYSLPALVPAGDQVDVEGVLYPDDETTKYSELLGICSDSVTSWETLMDDEASISSLWTDIFSESSSLL